MRAEPAALQQGQQPKRQVETGEIVDGEAQFVAVGADPPLAPVRLAGADSRRC